MLLWFTASMVSQVGVRWELSQAQIGWLVTAVNLGFVAVAAVAAVLNLADMGLAGRHARRRADRRKAAPYLLDALPATGPETVVLGASAAAVAGAPRDAVGTAITLQTYLGFLLDTVTIQVVPSIAEAVGWRWAFPVLALGPAVGIAAIRRLARLRRPAPPISPAGGVPVEPCTRPTSSPER